MRIREATAEDWPQVWTFFHEIVVAGETFAYDPEMTESEAREMWFLGPSARTVAAAAGGVVMGSANMYANQPGAARTPRARASW